MPRELVKELYNQGLTVRQMASGFHIPVRVMGNTKLIILT